MANFERDKDERVYDGSEDDDGGEGSHLPVVIIIAILVLAAFGGVVWLAYNQGVARGRNDPVRVASTETADPGNGGQLKIYQEPAGAEDEDDGQPAAAQSKPADTPPPQAVARSDTPPPAQTTPPPQQTAQAAAPKAQTPPPPAPKPAAQAASKPPVQVAQATPKTQTPPAKPQAQTPAVATKPPAQLVQTHPAAETPKPSTAKPVVTAAAPKPTATKPVAGGSYLLQIGAYKSEAEAANAWKIYMSKHGALVAGFGPDVQRADLGDKGVWYRLRISSFADKDAAVALCERLKAQSGACFLVR